ncbi:MAG: hypothetical protein KKG76_11730 [Euryarchaeota archaeon]|nr:hypothetical protein [Euryarchaeota archaeon]
MFHPLCSPESLKLTQDDMNKRIRGEPGKEAFVLDVIDKKGMHHCMEIRRRVVQQGDKIMIYGIGRDITEKRKQLEIISSDGSLQRLEIVCKNGEHRIVEIRTKGIKNDDGTIEVFGMAKDLTENILLTGLLMRINWLKP